MLKRLTRWFALALCIILFLGFTAKIRAASISNFNCGISTGWKKKDNEAHMGQKYTTYTYENISVQLDYTTYFQQGIALWGSAITCVSSAASPDGTIKTMDDQNYNAYANASVNYDSNGHVTTWTITINIHHFDSLPEDKKAVVLAHELGHFYGLAHVTSSREIMCDGSFNDSGGPTERDFAGMSVMTHNHTHNGSYGKTYKYFVTTPFTHRVTCTTCKAYHDELCSDHYTSRSYHSGDKHYWEQTCICGRVVTQSWYCSGNPCVEPFGGVVPEVETE